MKRMLLYYLETCAMICIEMVTYPLEPRGDPCCDLGMFQAIIYISSEHNFRRNNKNKLFPTILS